MGSYSNGGACRSRSSFGHRVPASVRDRTRKAAPADACRVRYVRVRLDRRLRGNGLRPHANVRLRSDANRTRADELDAVLRAGRAEFEKVRIDNEARLVTVTAQVRVKPGDVDNLLEGLRRNEKARAFEIE